MTLDDNDRVQEVEEWIDQSYELLEKGDVRGAQKMYSRAASRAGSDAQVLTLAGCIASERGEYAEAIERFEDAMGSNPTHYVALINAAEVYLDGLGDAQGCVEVCERALPLADVPEAQFELILFKAQALTALGREDEARQSLLATKGIEVGDPALLERVGGMAIALEDWDTAEGALSAALRIDPDYADAHYGMGWVCLEREHLDKMREHWLRTLELDQKSPLPDWHLTPGQFDEYAEKALMEIPEKARVLLQDVPIIVEDMPSALDVEDGLDPRVLGVFCGASRDEQSHLDAGPEEPNVIKLYQRNLESMCGSRKELIEEIRVTLLHETAHFFGLEEEEIERLGLA